MAFEQLKDQAGQAQEETRAYIDSTFEYYKLWSFKVIMKSTTMGIKAVLISICVIMICLFGSLAAAFGIGNALDSDALGFVIVGGFYLVCLFLVFFFFVKIVEGPILRKFSDIYFND